ncbi:MAG TPA: NHL repeat-containing protein [Blastocatellia bacterium]|nr:NHL repeat-containing protein [Blastocatellia bacterium]
MRKALVALLILLIPSLTAVTVYYLITRKTPTNRDAIGDAATLAGAGRPGVEDGKAQAATFSDPFGVAVDNRGNVIIADAGQGNRIRVITAKGDVGLLAGSDEGYRDGPAAAAQFNTPSGIALDKDSNIIIADTSNNRIRKVTADLNVITVAGSGEAGFKDGPASEAQFDGPIGVAVDKNGNIFVADSYNDRVRKISTDGSVSTVAGAGSPGFSDGAAAQALFDTPSGVAVDEKGNVFVADTGNRAVRKITAQGEVTSVAGGEQAGGNEQPNGAGFSRPLGILVTHDDFLFVTDAGRGQIIRITPEGQSSVYAGVGTGYAEGRAARFNGPAGIAIDREGNLYVADSQNYLIRIVSPAVNGAAASTGVNTSAARDVFIQPPAEIPAANPDAVVPRLSAAPLNVGQSFPWPLNPQNQWHEVAGVVGEARGATGGVALDHLHAGLDVRGNMGERVVAVMDEKVSAAIPNWGFDETGEGVRVGLMTYIHIRVGRDVNDQIQSPAVFKPVIDGAGKPTRVRVRRGTRFRVGDFIGTLNRLYHVHLNFGPTNSEANAIEFPFVDFKDTVAPTIEPNGVEVITASGQPFDRKGKGRLTVSGDVDIVVTAYDRVDGNVGSRKLGLYRAGYQLLKEDGSPVAGYEQPLINIEFNRLPPGDESVFLTYAAGSGVSAYGTPTKFRYIVTNRVRDAEARDGLLRTANLTPGNYIIRVIAEDHAGNRASGKSTELPITVVRQ